MSQPIYARLSDEYAELIHNGQLRSGERLPSVRQLAEQRRVSAVTALAVLRQLETRGLAEARPQSGYFVRRIAARAGEPQMSSPPTGARTVVGVNGLADRVLASIADPQLVALGSAVPDPAWFPLPRLQRLLARGARRRPDLLGSYGELHGLGELRRQIARRYLDLGCRLDPDEIVITSGCMEALNIALRSVARAGDHIAVESPTYFGMLQILESLGLKAVEIATHPREGLSLEALQERLDARGGERIRACLTISSFSNPLGASLPEPRREALVGLCATRGIALIEDDIYGDLAFGSARPRPIRSFDNRGQVILCSSFSKTLAPGARIGWIAAGQWTQVARQQKYISSVSTAPMMQAALAALLQSGNYERHLQQLRRRCAAQVARMSARVVEHFPEGTRLSRPDGGFLLWVELPEGIDTLPLFEQAVAAGISFLPGALFSASGRYPNCLRLNCGQAWTPKLEQAVATLGRLCREAGTS